MPAEDFDSFQGGFNLDSASYSGGASGVFSNILPGRQTYQVNGVAPTFENRAGVEGVNFPTTIQGATATGEFQVPGECTVIMTFQPLSGASVWPFGGTDPAVNTFGIFCNGSRAQAFSNLSSGWATMPLTEPHVVACSWTPRNGTTYVQVDDGPVQSTTDAVNKENSATNYWDAYIGGHRTTYGNFWGSRILFFSRSLHFRDQAGLDSLMLEEMARIGL